MVNAIIACRHRPLRRQKADMRIIFSAIVIASTTSAFAA